jgi:hypothetical protein
MNKEIIHQAAQAHAEKSFIQPLNAQGEVMSILGILFRTATESIANWLKNILKPEYFDQEQQLKPAAKPLIKKNLRRGSV